MIVVLSPAKKLDFETPAPTKKFTKLTSLPKAETLIKELRKCDATQISKLMKLSDDLTSLNMKRYQEFSPPFTLENAKQAMFAFKGDTYVGLDADTMNSSEIKFAQDHLRILSGLYGLLSPLDLVQPYRLEMGTKFPVGDNRNLYDFWRTTITEQLNELLEREEVLINCASNEYFKAVETKKLKGSVITPAFKEKKGNDFKMVGFFAKKARGMMSRYIIENEITNPKDLLSFDKDGYRYNKKLSSENEPVFTRESN